VPLLTAAEGPIEDPTGGWGLPSDWPLNPSSPLRSPLTSLGPCDRCGNLYTASDNCPFKSQCHECWAETHILAVCPTCPAPLSADPLFDQYEEEPGLVASDPES
jgi:hypothetical protein